MKNQDDKFKLGTADTVLLAVGTLAVDYICTSKSEIVEVQPGGKKLCLTREDFEEKIQRYGIVKGPHYPGSSIGNFLSQAQKLNSVNPNFPSVHLATTMALKDPLAKLLLKSLDEFNIQYEITDFNEEYAANPVALLVEARGYTKIISYKDKRFPPIEVNDPKHGKPGMMIIGAAAGHTIESKQNALNYALKNKLPIGMITTEGEISELGKNKPFKKIIDDILKNASFLSCNEDEVRKILLAEKPNLKLPRDRVQQGVLLREAFDNPNLDLLLSSGAEGSLAIVGNHAVIQHIPDTDHREIVSTAGAGDTLAGAFVQGVRMKGMTVEGVQWTLPRANRAAKNVLKYADTRTGQFTAEQFLEEPPEEFKVEVVTI